MESLIKKANILIEALPYIRKFSGKLVVIKYGGNAMINEQLRKSVMEDVTLLKFIGLKPVLVHGGGPDINQELSMHNITSQFVGGLRVTDQNTVKIAQMVLIGKTNKEIVSALCKEGADAIGLCGIDANLIECEKYMPLVDGVPTDIGYVGEVTNIKTDIIHKFADDEYIPVIAPIGTGKDGQSYNVNADTIASRLAAALKAEKLMFLTDIEGVRDEKGDIIYEIEKEKILKYIEDGVITDGMIPKVQSAAWAIKQGVTTVHIIDGTIPHCLLLEIFTDLGIGTMIKG